MFQFTTQNLLNDLSRVSVVTHATDKAVTTNGTGLKIKGLNTFLAHKMSPVWKAAGVAAVKQAVTITFPAITAGLYRLSLAVKLDGSAEADYSRWDDSYGKPIDVEINLSASDTGITLAAKLQKWFNKSNAPASTKGITVTGTATTLVITANSEYVRFQKSSILEKYDETNDIYVPYSTAFAVTIQGNTGFGTTWNLLKNFRIPTQEATYFTAENLDERPIAGSLYNQYTFEYTANRNIHGMGALGETTTSVTTHVLYVLSNLASSFETLLATLNPVPAIIVVSADPATPVDDEQGDVS